MTAIGDFMKLWMQDDATSRYLMQKALLGLIDEYVKKGSDTLKRIKVGPSISNPEVTWMEEWAYPDTIVGTYDGTTSFTVDSTSKLFGSTVTADSIQQVLRVGTILERPNGGGQIKVSALTGVTDGSAPWVVTVAVYPANAAPAADNTDVQWNIISEVITDYTSAGSGRSLPRVTRKVGTQIHGEAFEIPKTRQNTAYELIGDESEHQIKRLLEKLRRQLGHCVLKSMPYHTGAAYGYATVTQESTMLGLLNWPTFLQAELANTDVFVNAASVNLTKTMLDDLVRNHWLTENADYNSGDWAIVCHPLVHSQIQDFDSQYRQMTKTDKTIGFHVDTFDSKIGKTFPLISDQYIREGVLQLVDFSQVSYGYYKNDRIDRKKIETDNRVDKWWITFQTYGVVARNARTSVGAQIYGLATS